MTFLRLTGSLLCAIGITLLCCLIAPLMSRESDLRLPEPGGCVHVFSLPSLVKKSVKTKIVPQKIVPNFQPRREKIIKKTLVPPAKIRLSPLKMDAVCPMAVGLPPPLSAPLSGTQDPVKTATLKTGSGAADVYMVALVDAQPRLKQYRPPLYPPRARGQRIEGKVVVRCVVTAGGKVKGAKIIQAKPVGYFEQAALKAIKTWRFVPATLKGEKVSVYVDIPLSFNLD